MRDFKTLHVWQQAHALTLAVYRATQAFPDGERYGLTSQVRRAAASLPSNLAEGCGRSGDAELSHFSHIAMGSASELEYQLLLAHDLSYLPDERYQSLERDLVQLKRMLNVFIQKLQTNR